VTSVGFAAKHPEMRSVAGTDPRSTAAMHSSDQPSTMDRRVARAWRDPSRFVDAEHVRGDNRPRVRRTQR